MLAAKNAGISADSDDIAAEARSAYTRRDLLCTD
jgi:hypothetical protein